MNKNLLIAILSGVVLLESGYLVYRHFYKSPLAAIQNNQRNAQGAPGQPARGGARPTMLSKGGSLNDSPLKQFAYQIAPGTISEATKAILIGFTIDSKSNPDGSITVTVTPKDSKDQNQQYTIKSGQILYFIEQTPIDDKTDSDTDMNYRDDYGLITDSNGIVQ